MAKKSNEWETAFWQWWQEAIDNKDYTKALELARTIEVMKNDKTKRRNK